MASTYVYNGSSITEKEVEHLFENLTFDTLYTGKGSIKKLDSREWREDLRFDHFLYIGAITEFAQYFGATKKSIEQIRWVLANGKAVEEWALRQFWYDPRAERWASGCSSPYRAEVRKHFRKLYVKHNHLETK